MQAAFVPAPFALAPTRLHRRALSSRHAVSARRVRMCAEKPSAELAPEEREREARLAEQERLRAAEKFVVIDEGNYECMNCGYVYEESKGERLSEVKAGTPFEDIGSSFVCPVCKSPKRLFKKKQTTIAGFAENQQYGFGTNSLTGGQKNLLIFGALAFFFLLLLSGYALD